MQYKDEEFVTTNTPTDGVLIFDVNCQGIVDLAPHLKRFKDGFPVAFKQGMIHASFCFIAWMQREVCKLEMTHSIL